MRDFLQAHKSKRLQSGPHATSKECIGVSPLVLDHRSSLALNASNTGAGSSSMVCGHWWQISEVCAAAEVLRTGWKGPHLFRRVCSPCQSPRDGDCRDARPEGSGISFLIVHATGPVGVPGFFVFPGCTVFTTRLLRRVLRGVFRCPKTGLPSLLPRTSPENGPRIGNGPAMVRKDRPLLLYATISPSHR